MTRCDSLLAVADALVSEKRREKAAASSREAARDQQLVGMAAPRTRARCMSVAAVDS